jgi:hypothetical protein
MRPDLSSLLPNKCGALKTAASLLDSRIKALESDRSSIGIANATMLRSRRLVRTQFLSLIDVEPILLWNAGGVA